MHITNNCSTQEVSYPKNCTYILPKKNEKENSNTNPNNNFVLKWVRELVPSEENIWVSVQLPDNAQNKHVIRDLIKINKFLSEIRKIILVKIECYMRRRLPMVWSSLSMVNDAALIIFVSLSYDTL
jgi:hypothetical protein